MVCFTAHTFRFNNDNKQNWFNLLCKYYEGVNITAITDDIHRCRGKISLDFFNNTLIPGSNYTLETERFWAEGAAIKCLPQYNNTGNCKLTTEENCQNNSKIVKKTHSIDSVIESRSYHGGQEIFLSNKTCVDTFDDLLTAFSLIKNTSNITRLYISFREELIVIVLKDRHTLVITKNNVSDATLPIFDVDDGFLPNAFDCGLLMEEFNVSFKTWLSEFKKTNGDNWNSPVVSIDILELLTLGFSNANNLSN